jgi:hypothetical protein
VLEKAWLLLQAVAPPLLLLPGLVWAQPAGSCKLAHAMFLLLLLLRKENVYAASAIVAGEAKFRVKIEAS